MQEIGKKIIEYVETCYPAGVEFRRIIVIASF